MIIQGDCLEILKTLDSGIVQTCVTSPPYYGLRDYGMDGQIGLEESPEAYVKKLVAVFREVRRVLKDDGTIWLNLGDSYAGSGGPGSQYDSKSGNGFKGEFKKYDNPNRKVDGIKPKDIIGIPWMVAFALRADGWYLRSDIIWSKPNPMPESVTDRPTRSHEYIFLLSKSARYYYDAEAIKTPTQGPERDKHARVARKRFPTDKVNGIRKEGFYPMANARDVWTVNTKPYKEAHFATFPPDLIKPCILAGCPPGGIVLDPFFGSGTTGAVAKELGRDFIGLELNPKYIELAEKRIAAVNPPLFTENL